MRNRHLLPRPDVAWEDTTDGRINRLVGGLGASDLRFEVRPATDGGMSSQEWRVSAVFYAEDQTEVRYICTTKCWGIDRAVEHAFFIIEQERLRAALPEVAGP